MEVQQQIINLLVERLGVNPDQVTLSASLEKDLGADSLDAADLVVALNSGYKIQITAEQMERVETVTDLINLVNKHLARNV